MIDLAEMLASAKAQGYKEGKADAIDEAIKIALGNYHTKISAYELEKLKEKYDN